jgi:hypothetical protein
VGDRWRGLRNRNLESLKANHKGTEEPLIVCVCEPLWLCIMLRFDRA